MADQTSTPSSARRSFLARLGAGMAAAGAAMAAGTARAQTPASGATWQPARHAQDDWMDALPGKHRILFDTTSANGFGTALLYANNFLTANQTGYGLDDSDAAVIIVARHVSTPFAYTDAMWAKYGAPITARTAFNDPSTKRPPVVNLFNTTTAGLSNSGVTIDALIKRGAHFAVCQMATRVFATQIAQTMGVDVDTVYKELAGNMVKSTHMVPAGIVAVNRAQERGYTLDTTL